MKRFIILLIAGVLISETAFAQGWEPQVSPTTNNLNAVVFVDSSYGWAVGDSGMIIRTADGGIAWTFQTSGTTIILNDVDFVDENNGWAVGGYCNMIQGDSIVILHTTDGGGTWTTQAVPDSVARVALTAVEFLDVNNGWAVGECGQRWGLWSSILHTTNGGETWARRDSVTLANGLGCVTFVDSSRGWAVGWVGNMMGPSQGAIVRTTDGGGTWILDTFEFLGRLTGVHFVDVDNGWAVGYTDDPDNNQAVILHTVDGGETWTIQNGDTAHSLSSVDFVDANTGWAVGTAAYPDSDRVILRTSNGGTTWTVQISNLTDALHDVSFVDANHGWAVGYYGTILRYNPTLDVPDQRGVAQPSFYSLVSCPNPFNPSTTIAFNLPNSARISLRVFDLLGREVSVLKDGMMEAGTHRVMFDGSSLATGIYFARLDAGAFSQTKKLMLLK
jgi:photosystem II stability/assembly factor-like uncharacterized protein